MQRITTILTLLVQVTAALAILRQGSPGRHPVRRSTKRGRKVRKLSWGHDGTTEINFQANSYNKYIGLYRCTILEACLKRLWHLNTTNVKKSVGFTEPMPSVPEAFG